MLPLPPSYCGVDLCYYKLIVRRLRLFFVLLVVEFAVALTLGFMTLDNSPCDSGNGWQWMYNTQPVLPTPHTCPFYNISVATSESRFIAFEITIAIMVLTSILGLIVIVMDDKKLKHTTKSPTDKESARSTKPNKP